MRTQPQISFEAIGTKWLISLPGISDRFDLQGLRSKIFERIDLFDRDYSRFRKDSLVTYISANPGKHKLPKDAKPMFDLYQDLYVRTDGKFTPLIGSLMAELGYDAGYSLKPTVPQVPPPWESLNYNFPYVNTKERIILDVGAAGKGYLVDIVSDIIRGNDMKEYVINAGGDILLVGLQIPYKIGLENPWDFNEIIGIAELNSRSICASSGNRRKWGKYHHLVDPTTLTSAEKVVATWVVADTCMLADALATCLFFCHPTKLSRYDFEYVILYQDRSFTKSKNFPGAIYKK